MVTVVFVLQPFAAKCRISARVKAACDSASEYSPTTSVRFDGIDVGNGIGCGKPFAAN